MSNGIVLSRHRKLLNEARKQGLPKMTEQGTPQIFNIPLTWHCIRCGEDFLGGPMDEQPYAFEVVRDPKTGDRARGGDICRDCYLQESST